MPFLTKKTADMRVTSLTPYVTGMDSGLAWLEDEYRPSNGIDGPGGLERFHLPKFVPQRRLCGHIECANGWTPPWRSRRRPIFEGNWGCGGRCVLGLVEAAVGRELSDAVHPDIPSPHRHRIPLGLMMLSQGWITQAQLRKALSAQREKGTGRIGDWLKSECGLSAEQIMRGVSMQWGCPVLSTEGFSPDLMALVLPKIFVERLGVLPLRVAGSKILYLGFSERLDASTALAAEQMSQLKVESGVVDADQFEAARCKLLECAGAELKAETTTDKDSMAARITAILEQKRPVESRLVRLHEYYWLRMWLEHGSMSKVGTLPATGEDVLDYVFSLEHRVL
jgi:hypothetical protein